MKRNLYIDFKGTFAQGLSFSAYRKQNAATNTDDYRVLRAETMRALNQCLTTRQREMLVHYYLCGTNIPALAKRYGLNKSTVSRHITAAKRKIKKSVLTTLCDRQN